MKIVVAGSGKLASAIITSDLSFPFEIVKWETQDIHSDEKAIILHAGSGRQLKEIVAFCSRTKSILIELSTGLETENMNPDYPLIICPNTSVLLLKTLSMIKSFGSKLQHYTISITESHQSTKSTEPATAYYIADSLNVPHNRIVSIRDPAVQQNRVGIPPEFLSRHAYHKIVIRDHADEVSIETKVLGHTSYVNGVKAIVEACIKHHLENKRYTVLDFVDNDML